ncbi:MAG: DUF3853 family protein [Candidatus Magasanikbacteria bacterium]|nr:DUF3853 family protein [Candidatus Magasanikbacteria bacterium]
MNTTIITNDTPLALLTVGQLLELVQTNKPEPMEKEESKVYVYGLRGIRKLFNVSHATAQRYKDTIIRDAVLQQGRKIITDANKAMELFNAKNGRVK